MARVAEYSDEIRAAVIAALLAGATISGAARQFNLAKSTVSLWREAAAAQGSMFPTTIERSIERSTSVDLGGLVADYLTANLTALTLQARTFGDPGWIAQQDAHALVAVHNALADRAVRLLSAISPSEPEADRYSESDPP